MIDTGSFELKISFMIRHWLSRVSLLICGLSLPSMTLPYIYLSNLFNGLFKWRILYNSISYINLLFSSRLMSWTNTPTHTPYMCFGEGWRVSNDSDKKDNVSYQWYKFDPKGLISIYSEHLIFVIKDIFSTIWEIVATFGGLILESLFAYVVIC